MADRPVRHRERSRPRTTIRAAALQTGRRSLTPNAWQFAVLALAAFRLSRLVGWDDFPPIARARAWITGEEWHVSAAVPEFAPGVHGMSVSYRRPLLAHFLACAYCQGFWISVAVWASWHEWPRPTLVAMTPLALSAAVGLIARRWDP